MNEYELSQGLENTEVTEQGGDRARKGEEPVSMSQCHQEVLETYLEPGQQQQPS